MFSLHASALAGISGLVVFSLLAFSSPVSASSHSLNNFDRNKNPGIDMIITGANKRSLELDSPPSAADKKGDCPLCYHRELMKQNEGNNREETLQPFPGD